MSRWQGGAPPQPPVERRMLESAPDGAVEGTKRRPGRSPFARFGLTHLEIRAGQHWGSRLQRPCQGAGQPTCLDRRLLPLSRVCRRLISFSPPGWRLPAASQKWPNSTLWRFMERAAYRWTRVGWPRVLNVTVTFGGVSP